MQLECEVTFLTKEDGGRSAMPILVGGIYRPLLVAGDPRQREPVLEKRDIELTTVDGRRVLSTTDKFLTEEHLAVLFESAPNGGVQGEPLTVVLTPFEYLESHPDKLPADATFTIREGAKVVGFGKVLRWF